MPSKARILSLAALRRVALVIARIAIRTAARTRIVCTGKISGGSGGVDERLPVVGHIPDGLSVDDVQLALWVDRARDVLAGVEPLEGV